jgi:hypothetical protein
VDYLSRHPPEATVLDRLPTVVATKMKMLALVAAATTAGGTGAYAVVASVTPAPLNTVTVASDTTASPDPSVTDSPTTDPSTGTDPTDTASPTDSPTDSPDPSPTDSVGTNAAPTDGSTPTCPAGVTNHGQYESSDARDKIKTCRDHGKAVSEAAHSDCGKTAPDSTGTDGTTGESADPTDTASATPTDSPTDTPTTTPSTDGSASTGSATTSGHGHGHGNGHGHH